LLIDTLLSTYSGLTYSIKIRPLHLNSIYDTHYEVSMAVIVQIVIFNMKMEAACFSETLVTA
jgi:hypothetical protein